MYAREGETDAVCGDPEDAGQTRALLRSLYPRQTCVNPGPRSACVSVSAISLLTLSLSYRYIYVCCFRRTAEPYRCRPVTRLAARH